MTKLNGGQAFPGRFHHPGEQLPDHFTGMTLRAYLVGQVLAGGDHSPDCEWKPKRWAEYAAKVADACIAELSKGG